MKENKTPATRVNIVFALLVFAASFFIAADSTPAVNFLKRFAYYMLFPTAESAAFFTERSGEMFEGMQEMVFYKEQNAALKKQNAELSDRLRNFQGLEEENKRLSALLNFPPQKNTKTVFARVIMREAAGWYEWLTINKGSADGITRELAVIAASGDGTPFAVGRVAETFDYSSKVALITNSKSAVPLCFGVSGVDCLAEGTGTNRLKLTYIPGEAEMFLNDEVLTSPLSSVFATATPVGRVKEILPQEMLGYKTAFADLYMAQNKIYEVAVIVPVGAEMQND